MSIGHKGNSIGHKGNSIGHKGSSIGHKGNYILQVYVVIHSAMYITLYCIFLAKKHHMKNVHMYLHILQIK